MQEKQLLSRLNVAEQRIVDLYHKLKSTSGGGSITVNGNIPVTNLTIGPVLEQTYSNGSLGITINPYPGYRVYRAKIAMQSVDWLGYGYLYNWFAVDDARGLANPTGGTGLTAPNLWRVPSNTDWDTLVTFAGGTGVAGGKLKSTLTSTDYPFNGWLNNGGGTDDYNFNALGGGRRNPNGNFIAIAEGGVFWSTTTVNPFSKGVVSLIFSSSNANTGSDFPETGLSVRLVREATAGELLLADGDTSDTSSLYHYTGNDGKTYVTVKIGTQIWLAQNLRETKYNDNSDIFNAGSLIIFGGDANETTWQAKGAAQEGAWTAYLFGNTSPNFPGSGNLVEYDPTTVKLFYNDVLENTLVNGIHTTFYPVWESLTDINGPIYRLKKFSASANTNWQKTHIKITPGYDVNNFPTINETSLLIEKAVTGADNITFRPIRKDGTTGAITIEDLNNYNDLLGGITSYVYVEILEYTQDYYSQSVGIGISNL